MGEVYYTQQTTLEDAFHGSLFSALVLHCDQDSEGAPVLARKVRWRVFGRVYEPVACWPFEPMGSS